MLHIKPNKIHLKQHISGYIYIVCDPCKLYNVYIVQCTLYILVDKKVLY